MDVRTVAVAALMCGTAGCSTLAIDRQSIPTEAAYQLLNAADFSQTVTIARNPAAYRESGWPTADIIGRHPSVSKALAFGALQGLAHYAVTGWLDREADATGAPAWNVARWVWNIGTLYAPARNVWDNHRAGISFFGGVRPESQLPLCPPQGTVLSPGFRCRFPQ